MDLLIGLDIGTTAIKGILVSTEGRIYAVSSRRNKLYHNGDMVELSPEEHYVAVCQLIKELTSASPRNENISAICIAAASGNTLLLDQDLAPLTPIVSWLDKRSLGKFDQFLPDLDTEEIHNTVGWTWAEMFSLAHLAWWKKNTPDIYKKASHICMNNDYLTFRLSGEWGLDPSTATTSYLQDQKFSKWHQPYLKELEIDESKLSPILPPGTILGTITPDAARDTGLSQSTQLVLGSFDHPCAARGTGIFSPGNVLLSCGTSWVLFYPCEDRNTGLQAGLLIDPFLQDRGIWAHMSALSAVGVNIDTIIDHTLLNSGEDKNKAYDKFNKLAEKAKPAAGGFLLNPFDSDWLSDQGLRKLRQNAEPENIARALMEGVAMEIREELNRLGKYDLEAKTITMVGGPSESRVWPAIVSDICSVPIRLINGQVSGAMGAAILAGLGIGLFNNEEEGFKAIGGRVRQLEPDTGRGEIYREHVKKYQHMKESRE